MNKNLAGIISIQLLFVACGGSETTPGPVADAGVSDASQEASTKDSATPTPDARPDDAATVDSGNPESGADAKTDATPSVTPCSSDSYNTSDPKCPLAPGRIAAIVYPTAGMQHGIPSQYSMGGYANFNTAPVNRLLADIDVDSCKAITLCSLCNEQRGRYCIGPNTCDIMKNTLSAGTVGLQLGGKPYKMDWANDNGVYAGALIELTEPVTRGTLLEAVASGAAVPEFRAEIAGSDPIVLTEPAEALNEEDSLGVDPSKPFTLGWSNPRGPEHTIELRFVSMGGGHLHCKVRDDGSFTINAATVKKLLDDAKLEWVTIYGNRTDRRVFNVGAQGYAVDLLLNSVSNLFEIHALKSNPTVRKQNRAAMLKSTNGQHPFWSLGFGAVPTFMQ